MPFSVAFVVPMEVPVDDAMVGAEGTVRINCPSVTLIEALAPALLPPIVSAPGFPVTVALPLLAINVYVPAASGVVVFTVTGALFMAKVPAEVPATVNGAVEPPP